MRVESIKTFGGVNYYAYEPAVVGWMDYGPFEGYAGKDVPGLVEGLLNTFPSLAEHRCKADRPDKFSDRLVDGVQLNVVIEHVALELFVRVSQPTIAADFACCEPRVRTDRVVIATRLGDVMRYLLSSAVGIVNDIAGGNTPEPDSVIEPARQILRDCELGPSGRCIIEAAERRGIPWTRENTNSLVQLGYGRNLHFVQAAATDLSSDIAVDIVGNKDETKRRLKQFSIPTPAGFVVKDEEEAVRAFERMEFPVAVKPLYGNQGKGVSLNIGAAEDVRQAFQHARNFSSRVIIEELFYGKNYRVLVVGGKMVAASERQAITIKGDGILTVQELVDIENRNPLRGEGHEKPLTKIRLTLNVIANLEKQGLSLSDIPGLNTTIEISNGMNLSTGGSARDVTDEVHRSVQLMCERAARTVNLDICGIDLMLEDIGMPLPQKRGGVIEINAAPGLRMHVFPSEGKPRDVGGSIIEMLYPDGAPSRIPIIAITGTNGKTTVTRLVAHVLGATGRNIGTTTTDGIMLNGESIVFGDTTGPASARTVLSDKIVDIAVLETARGGMLRRGLGWDWADIGVVTNITEDHIGQDGIESVKDLVEIKALIAERVREGGTLVLNADDEESANLVYRPSVSNIKRRVVFFSTASSNPIVEKHIREGGTAYILRDSTVCEAARDNLVEIVDSLEVPITVNGTAEYQIQNIMAAIAVARTMGMQAAAITDALKSFEASSHNQGRTNIYRVGMGLVVIDYGHNPKAIESISGMVSKWGMKSTGIISFPGDRRDDVIVSSSKQTAKGFDRIIIKGDKDLRGRKEGEVAQIMLKTIAENGGPSDTTIELDADLAFEREVAAIGENEVVVYFYEKLKPVHEILEKYNAVKIDNLNIRPSLDRAVSTSAN